MDRSSSAGAACRRHGAGNWQRIIVGVRVIKVPFGAGGRATLARLIGQKYRSARPAFVI
jgi:hypothetical protein